MNFANSNCGRCFWQRIASQDLQQGRFPGTVQSNKKKMDSIRPISPGNERRCSGCSAGLRINGMHFELG